MSDLLLGSPTSQPNVDVPHSPSILDDSDQNSWQEQPVVQQNDTLDSRDSDILVNEQSNEGAYGLSENTEDSNPRVVYIPDAAVPSWANVEDSNQSQPSVSTNSVTHSEDSTSRLSDIINGNNPHKFPEAHPRNDHDCDDSPPSKIRKINTSASDEVDAETCPICLDSWGNSGDHRLVALRCGHLFGSECVEKWLKAQKIKDRSCPTCKSRANLKDLRFIYARKLVAADTSQITSLQKQVETLQSEKNRTELDLQKSRIAHRACQIQLDILRGTLMKSQIKEQPVKKSWRFALEKNLEICKDGGCRVMTYNCRTYELYVSQKGNNYLFPGYGIRKVSCVDYRLGQFVLLHKRPIRDITYSQPRDLLLSVGLDSTARIVERGIPNVTVNAGIPLWSCSWDYLRSNEFFVGGVGGVIYQYDVRNPGSHIQVLGSAGDMSPVVSLCSTEYGLLSCQLNSCKLWTSTMRQWVPRSLPATGSFTSLCYDAESRRVCVSSRASVGSAERSKLMLYRLKGAAGCSEVHCDLEETFPGSAKSTIMSRAAWVRAPGSTWVGAHSESEASLHLYGVDGSRSTSLPASEPALDVTAVELNGQTLLAALSDSRLRIYKAVSTGS